MEFLVANHSGFPNGEEVNRGETGGRGAEGRAVYEQEAAGADVVTDGHSPWNDPVAHILAGVEGLRLEERRECGVAGVTYLCPRVFGRLGGRSGEDRAVPPVEGRARLKAVLPGPYTLARLSVVENGAYDGIPALAEAFADLLLEELRRVVGFAAYVQIEEPAILRHPEDIRLLRRLLEPFWEARGTAQIVVATYGAGAERLYAQLNSLPADVIGLDLVAEPQLAGVIAETGSGKILALGLVDVHSEADPSAQALAAGTRTMLARYVLDTIHLQPARGLLGLPASAARRKLQLLAATCALLRERR